MPSFRSVRLALLIPFLPSLLHAQLVFNAHGVYTRADTLRGSIGPERAWWDVTHYDVHVAPDFTNHSIEGLTTISFTAVAKGQRMQIDLQEPLVVDSITESAAVYRDGAFLISEQAVHTTREGNVVWVDLPTAMKAGDVSSITVYYHGVPRAAKRPPWDGGWIWKTDEQGNPWMSVACQGLGASVWYPCKDHQSDEPDSAALWITVPDTLQAIGNGRLREKLTESRHRTTWIWAVTNPINSYNLIPYIGKYAHFGEVYEGTQGKLDCDYWVLAANETKAREHFKQVPSMLRCFEEWFGPYPFYEDGYKLVESPHLGMEHQSAVAYGNKYLNGYLGSDLSGTGRGLEWDFIIVHESGHEWFGNSITTADIADMWVHEGFTNYSETIFTQCQQGEEAGNDYVVGCRKNIHNDIPIIGPYGVNQEGSGDMYHKSASMLHTIRHIVGDSVFKAMLLEMNKRFYHSTVTSAEVESFFSMFCKRDLSKLFDQYLRTTQVPVLEWGVHKKKLYTRWTNCIDGFATEVALEVGGKTLRCTPGQRWQAEAIPVGKKARVQIDRNWYVDVRKADKAALIELRSIP
ncbi:MAG: M1 family metallopeptidase [Flavobacteriales bacterium]|nr:M1 family metallopeptidase [Flavobacteriales bacterium]MBK7270236.1 M1 family metallopeptidase [Flavobacteriales bacterium]MBK7754094.1 M1 family metallopeptidase [Flavobacteriales bacterium]MBK9075909.1 M1 family metallopeptidase [Flavobacteriales bacterium]MBK9537325.1 M1 family metallopeptidase [Flavobacteriales bacterium]